MHKLFIKENYEESKTRVFIIYPCIISILLINIIVFVTTSIFLYNLVLVIVGSLISFISLIFLIDVIIKFVKRVKQLNNIYCKQCGKLISYENIDFELVGQNVKSKISKERIYDTYKITCYCKHCLHEQSFTIKFIVEYSNYKRGLHKYWEPSDCLEKYFNGYLF